jgi:L1 cell adhesion molecule like protein
MSSNIIIGIDLGTTYSCVAYWNETKNMVEVIPNTLGHRTTPSYFSYIDGIPVVGHLSKQQAPMYPLQTIYDVKRFIGNNEVNEEYPFRTSKVRDTIVFLVGDKVFTPEDVSAHILSYLKKCAEEHLKCTITKAVITVPAYFSDAQRSATRNAGKMAGLDVLRIINEPTAASLAYITKPDKEENVLVFDLGGGTFDTTILTISDGVYDVKATAGNTRLGGEDFDNNLVNYCVNTYKVVNTPRLRMLCETAKRQLSQRSLINFTYEGIKIELTTDIFNKINQSLFDKTIMEVDKVLSDSNMSAQDIHEIILVGGSTRIPQIQEMLTNYFPNKKLNKSLNQDEAVAMGAAVQGMMLNTQSSTVLLDVIPLSLGVETSGGRINVLIPRNTKKPIKKDNTYTTNDDSQTEIAVNIYEGEREFVKDCKLLGSFVLSGIPRAPKGIPKIQITFNIDFDGILSVTAKEVSTGIENKITINQSTISTEDINKLLEDAKINKDKDMQELSRLCEKNKLEKVLDVLKKTIISCKSDLSEEDYIILKKLIIDKTTWLDEHHKSSLDEYTKQIIEIETVSKRILEHKEKH